MLLRVADRRDEDRDCSAGWRRRLTSVAGSPAGRRKSCPSGRPEVGRLRQERHLYRRACYAWPPSRELRRPGGAVAPCCTRRQDTRTSTEGSAGRSPISTNSACVSAPPITRVTPPFP